MKTSRGIRNALITTALAGLTTWAVRDLPSQLGRRPLNGDERRADRVRKSTQFENGRFRNPMPPTTTTGLPPVSVLKGMIVSPPERQPTGNIPVLSDAAHAPRSPELAASWLGHSSVLLDIDGARVLIDPVWSDRVSPSRLVGPRRLHKPPASMADLGDIEAVVLSHDHYDHLDRATILSLRDNTNTRFLVPLGVGAHLEHWGVPAGRVDELDWGDHVVIRGVTFTSEAAQHFSGRAFRRNDTLWSSWVIAGPQHRVFYAGDSGYFNGYRDIGSLHGPFDITIMPIGAYNCAWPDIHMTPEQAVMAHLDLRGKLLLPVHWGTFVLATHPWAEPVERLWREAKAHDVVFITPKPGELIDPTSPLPVDAWWKTLPRP